MHNRLQVTLLNILLSRIYGLFHYISIKTLKYEYTVTEKPYKTVRQG